VSGEILSWPGHLGVRPSFGDVLENLLLVRREPTNPRRPTPEPPEVREQEIEDRAIAFAEVPVTAVELESRTACIGRIEPEAHHVLDAERTIRFLVDPEAPVLAA
jgi:hypothetical protein